MQQFGFHRSIHQTGKADEGTPGAPLLINRKEEGLKLHPNTQTN